MSRITDLTRRGRKRRAVLSLLALPALVLALSACGSSSSSSSTATTPSTSPSSSASEAANTGAECTSPAILAALPGGADMEKFDCANVGGTTWAAAEVNPGNTVFFLQWNGTKWNAEDSGSVCGTASAGLPQSLLAYCTPSSPNTTPASAACTSQKILAAVPAGADMEKFTCAVVDGKQWAAAKVNPGNTVFFLQWNGTKWNTEDSGSVCGTASAGLPQSLLAYCNA